MNNPSLVSIIIPVFNRLEQTLTAIDSVLKQTYRPIEIIIVDDGSTDDIISPIMKLNSSEIKVIKHPENLGANKARNTGLEASQGDWIAFLDSDDTWDHSKIQQVMDSLLSQPKYGVGYCSMNMVKDGKTERVFHATVSGNLFKALLIENIVGSASVPIIKKTILAEIEGLDDTLKSAQDWDLWLRIADAGYLFLAIPEQLVNYKIPDSGLHISGSFEAFWSGRKKFLHKHQSKYSSHVKALAQVYSKTGFLLINRFNKRKIARSCFLKAIKQDPFKLKYWKGLIGTFFPAELYHKFISIDY